MEFDKNGLPKPGRELDAAVWGMLGHEVTWWWSYQAYDKTWHRPEGPYNADGPETALPAWVHKEISLQRMMPQPWYNDHGRMRVVPCVSTTHAYHSVMEAKRREWRWLIEQLDTTLIVWIYDAQDKLGSSELGMVELGTLDYSKSIEEIIAHAVCAAAWKVLGGENGT